MYYEVYVKCNNALSAFVNIPFGLDNSTMRVASMLTMSGGGVICALNGALQKRFVLPFESQLVPGNVHRIQEVQVGVGGKGQDVAIALSCLGYEKMAIAQFIGQGAEGDQVLDLLEDRVGADALKLTTRTASPLRTCTSVVAADTTTELIEPSGAISPEEMSDLLSKLAHFEGGSAAAVCVMGSMPPGCPETTYAEIYERSANPDTLCVIDSVAGLKPLIEKIAQEDKRGPTIFKVNASELCALSSVKKSNNEVDGVKQDELIAAIQGFFAGFQPAAAQALTAIAITDGKHLAYLAVIGNDGNDFKLFKLPVGTLQLRTLFPIGAGDAVAAGTLAAWQSLKEGNSDDACLPENIKEALSKFVEEVDATNDSAISTMLTAFSFGLACGSASCLQEENSMLLTEDVLRLLSLGKPAFLSSHSL